MDEVVRGVENNKVGPCWRRADEPWVTVVDCSGWDGDGDVHRGPRRSLPIPFPSNLEKAKTIRRLKLEKQ